MYLFGTVHLLPGHTGWRSPVLDKALADSGTLYIEITDDDPVHVQLLVLKYGTDLQQPLSSRLNPGDRNRLQRAVRIAALPGGEALLEPMKPWLAALTLSMAPLLKAGLDPKAGVDKQLKAQFEAAGKPVKGLETSEEQIRFFADMQPKTQLAFLRSVLTDYGQRDDRAQATGRALGPRRRGRHRPHRGPEDAQDVAGDLPAPDRPAQPALGDQAGRYHENPGHLFRRRRRRAPGRPRQRAETAPITRHPGPPRAMIRNAPPAVRAYPPSTHPSNRDA